MAEIKQAIHAVDWLATSLQTEMHRLALDMDAFTAKGEESTTSAEEEE